MTGFLWVCIFMSVILLKVVNIYIYMHINVCIFSVCVKKLCFPGTTSGNTSCHLMEIITIQEICIYIYILFRYGFLHNMCRPIFT